jgi:ankyrin repeat protein
MKKYELRRAIYDNDDKKALELFRQGVDVDMLWSEIMLEVSSPELALIYIEKGADINSDCRPLRNAAKRGDLEVVKILVEHGAKDKADYRGFKAIDYAIRHKRNKTRKFLHEWGSEPNWCIHLIYAIRQQNLKKIQTILGKGVDLNRRYSDDPAVRLFELPLIEAIKTGDIQILKLLIKNGADVNVSGYRTMTPLDIAICRNQEEVVRFLREHGAKESNGDE